MPGLALFFYQEDPMPTYTITSEQLHMLEEIFQCLIEVENSGNLRAARSTWISCSLLGGWGGWAAAGIAVAARSNRTVAR
jgi:hypothetical protein